jgi:hypothetical protein
MDIGILKILSIEARVPEKEWKSVIGNTVIECSALLHLMDQGLRIWEVYHLVIIAV